MGSFELKFVVLVGSLRRSSFSRVISQTLDELAPDDVEVALLGSIGEIPHYSEDLQAIGIPDAVTAMAEAIRGADALVIVTPEYNHSMPGTLKNALDWLSRLPVCPLAAKPVAIQSSSPGQFGGVRMQAHLRQTLLALDANVLNGPEIALAHADSLIDQRNGTLIGERARSTIGRQLVLLAELVRRRGVSEAA